MCQVKARFQLAVLLKEHVTYFKFYKNDIWQDSEPYVCSILQTRMNEKVFKIF